MQVGKLDLDGPLDRSDRAGFTLIELLIVIAIIGVILSIALPAVQRVRESARRTQCSNNLHQIGVALQNCQAQNGKLPQDGFLGHGYGTLLLSFLDQRALFEAINPLVKPLVSSSAAVAGQGDVVLTVFRCPSDSGPHLIETLQFARSNYLGSSQLFSKANDLGKVHDGESTTIAIGETITEQAWALPGTASTDSLPNQGGRFGSHHTGGAQFVMCDASVRFISDNIDTATFRALGTLRGREPIGEF